MTKKIPLLSALMIVFMFSLANRLAADVTDDRGTDSPYGILSFLPWNHDWNHYHYEDWNDVTRAADLMQEAGVGIVRLDFVWADIEPRPGKFEFDRHDAIVDILLERGIKIQGMLHYNAAWADRPWNAPPDENHYVNYARKVVQHYKEKIKYWEIWNEPNYHTYWQPQDGMQGYTDLLKAVYPAIKEEDPSSVVLLGGLTGDVVTDLRRIYKNGGKNYFDIVNIHPFQDPASPQALDNLKHLHRNVLQVMGKYQDHDKRIWITDELLRLPWCDLAQGILLGW